MTLRSTRVTSAAVLAVGVTATLALGAGPAAAAPAAKPALLVSYDVSGSTTIANPNSGAVVQFAPTAIKVDLFNDGSFTANLPLAPVSSSFKAYGFLPARGTVVFTQVKPVTGALSTAPGTPLITSQALYTVSLRDVVIGGTKANVGTNCQTVYPVRVTVATQPGFDIGAGGDLKGLYTLSRFQNCGAAQTIINDTLPGPGNSLDLHFSNGLITVPGAAAAPVSAALAAQVGR